MGQAVGNIKAAISGLKRYTQLKVFAVTLDSTVLSAAGSVRSPILSGPGVLGDGQGGHRKGAQHERHHLLHPPHVAGPHRAVDAGGSGAAL